MTVKHLSVTWMCESDVLTSRTSDKKTDNSRCNQIETQAASWNDGRGVLPPGRPLFPLVSFLTGAVERVHRTEIPYGLVWRTDNFSSIKGLHLWAVPWHGQRSSIWTSLVGRGDNTRGCFSRDARWPSWPSSCGGDGCSSYRSPVILWLYSFLLGLCFVYLFFPWLISSILSTIY